MTNCNLRLFSPHWSSFLFFPSRKKAQTQYNVQDASKNLDFIATVSDLNIIQHANLNHLQFLKYTLGLQSFLQYFPPWDGFNIPHNSSACTFSESLCGTTSQSHLQAGLSICFWGPLSPHIIHHTRC
uniref:Uncharacterized protein n=1 Tax=Molossus molossus TaxID=27622 RepID=A0A7J8DBP0_MOLMO|nr:hypothetical protein HJG59_009363 [Molossus molossus]